MLATLVVVLMAQLLAPASARSVTSIALDLIPELETIFASESPHANVSETPPLTEETVNFASEMFAEFLPTIRETMIKQARAKQRSLDPAVDAQFEKMSRVMPKIIRLFGAIATRPKVDPSLEPALQDYTHTVLEKASETASNALNEAANQIKKQTNALISTSKAEEYPDTSTSKKDVETETPVTVYEETPPGDVVSDLQSYSPNALEGPNEAPASVQQKYGAVDKTVAPTAHTKFDLKFPFPNEALTEVQRSAKGSVYYTLPGGGFFMPQGIKGD